jgi:hypothetical protein
MQQKYAIQIGIAGVITRSAKSSAIVFLGLSAAFGGKWLEKVGLRLTMFVAACCFGGGFLVSALGVFGCRLYNTYDSG